MRAVVPDQELDAGHLRGLEEPLALLERVRHRLLDQRRHAAFQAGQGLLDMQVIRRREDHAVRAPGLEQRTKVGEEGHAGFGSQAGRGR